LAGVKVGVGGIEPGEVVFEEVDDAVLLGKRRKREQDALEFGDAQCVEATRRAGDSRELVPNRGGVPKQAEVTLIEVGCWPYTDEVVLVDRILDRAVPDCGAAYLARRPIAFDDQEIASLEAKSVEFTVEELHRVNVT
jgi:hypothetical protein